MGWTIHFSGGLPPWLGLVVAVIALAATILAYLMARKAASRSHMAFLTAVRAFGTIIVLIIALRPLVTYKTLEGRRGRYILMADTSRSMALHDYPNLPSRIDAVKAAIAKGSPTIEALTGNFQIELHSFAEGPRGEVPLAEIASLEADGQASAISRTLADIAGKAPHETTTGIILLSDGIDTDASPAEYTSRIPVHTVGVGARLSAEGTFKDLSLTGVEVLPAGEPVVSKDNVARLGAYVEGLGYPGLVATVALRDAAGNVVVQENITLDAERGSQRVVLSFTPDEKGNFKYSVEVAAQPRETILENNSQNLNITVTDPEIRVLYFEGTLRSEYKYLKRVLEKDPNIRLLSLVRLGERIFLQQGNSSDLQLTGFPKTIETLKKFNVIIVGDLDVSGFSPEDMQNIKDTVSDGAGLIMLGGYNSFSSGYRGTGLADVLPCEIAVGEPRQDKNEFVPQLTPLGEVSPVFAGVTDYFQGPQRPASRKIPPLRGQVRLGRVKPAASVLAVNPLRSDEGRPLPVLVVQNFGAGRTAAFAGDTTWRWFAQLRGLGLDSPYIRFWGQLVRWLARREAEEEIGEPGIEAWVDKAFYAIGDTARISARVRDGDGLLTDKATVSASMTGPEDLRVPLGTAAGAPGTYEAAFAPKDPGTYQVIVTGGVGRTALGESAISFEVGKEDLEMRRIDLDEDSLRAIAAASGGSYMPLVDFPALVARLKEEGATEKTVELLNLRQKKVLYPLFFAFIVLVTVEWVWRKRLHMP